MNASQRVLLTGHTGYIGSVMTPRLLEAGYDVTGLDTGYFRECTLGPDGADVPTIRKDIRDLTAEDLDGFHAVIHLAALSNDPIGNLNDRWTEEINHQGSVRLAELAREAGVERFLFSSSCIMYGMSEAAVVTEESPLDPKTEYARSKVRSELAIRELATDSLSPTFLRNGTIYGLSPRMRFDTVLNSLVGVAIATGEVVVEGDGAPWRPVTHVEDVARYFIAVLRAPLEVVHDQAFNTGSNELNYRVMELAEFAVAAVPGSRLRVLAKPSADQRTYRADFGKFERAFPEFRFDWDARRGALQLADALRGVGLDEAGFRDKRYTRLAWLQHLLDTGQLDDSLRWTSPEGRA